MEAAQSGDQPAVDAAADELATTMAELAPRRVPPLLDAYDRLIEAAPELGDDVRIVRNYTTEFVEVLSELDEVDDVVGAIEEAAAEGGMEAGAAVLRLDETSQNDCGIVLAD